MRDETVDWIDSSE